MSEQGQTPPPQEPSGDTPRADRPAPDQATTPLPADTTATPGQQPTAGTTPGPQPEPQQPEPQQAPPAATAAEPPPAAAPVPPVPPARRGRVRRVAGHRATQLVAVGLLGLVLGGGIVGAVAANRGDHRGGPGHVRMYERGERGPDRGDTNRGPGDRFDQRGPFGEGRPGDRFER
ncbi:hypothetical protein ACFWNN_28220 [Lentzea sp. NPDC058450]|uniref:hypothetical protein n=1 Tax=Lentzea sp. NPDC058450 TaxID=3346505 RepID=UPI00364F8249